MPILLGHPPENSRRWPVANSGSRAVIASVECSSPGRCNGRCSVSDPTLTCSVIPQRLWGEGSYPTPVREPPMPDSARFALHRPEFLGPLQRGEAAIAALMKGSRLAFEAGKTLIETGTEHPFVYRLISGWAGRMRRLEDGRNQFILIFSSRRSFFAVKSMFVTRHTDAGGSPASASLCGRQRDRRLASSAPLPTAWLRWKSPAAVRAESRA